MERDGGFASSISIWELGVKARRGKLELGLSVEELTRRIEQTGAVEPLPVDTTTWLRTNVLPSDLIPALRVKLRCPAGILVVTPSTSVARWAHQPLRAGPSLVFRP
jgi:hypothetical protein